MRTVSTFVSWLALALALAAAIWVAVPAQADAPTLLNYQGRLTDAGGAPINGTLSMTFRIYDALSGGTLLWSETQGSVSVANGLFSALLGSSTALPASVFDGTERYLEVQVGSETLSPRQRIASSAYSLRTGAPQSLSSSEPGAVITATNSSTSGTGVYGYATNSFGETYGGRFESASFNGTGVYGRASSSSGQNFGGLFSSAGTDGTGVYGSASAASGTTYGGFFGSSSTSGTGVRGWATAGSGTTYGVYGRSDSSGGGTGVYGQAPLTGVVGVAISATGSVGVYGLSRSTSGIGVQGHVTSTSGTTYGGYFQSDSSLGRAVYGYAPDTGGNAYGGYFVSGSRGIHVEGYSYGGEFSASASTGVADAVYAASSSTSGRGVYGAASASSGATTGVYGESYSTSGRGVFGYATASSGTTYGGRFLSYSPMGTAVYGYGSSGYGAHFVNSAAYTPTLKLDNGNTAGPLIEAYNGTDLEFKVHGNGNVTADGSFTGAGADFAELMAFEAARSRYEPGDVLVISTNADQTVALSQMPYSTLVAGVYSTKPGFVGGGAAEEAAMSNRLPVAMMGIVPTKVCAENGAIRRGDLLVTSSTPGHAMRAEDPRPGTVLGKALEPLEEGTGTILVLVTLQ